MSLMQENQKIPEKSNFQKAKEYDLSRNNSKSQKRYKTHRIQLKSKENDSNEIDILHLKK